MKVNLTDYIATFSGFVTLVEPIDSSMNSLVKAQHCYNKTKDFVSLLKKHQRTFLGLDQVGAKINAVNELFADLLYMQTKCQIKLGDDRSLETTPRRIQYSHALAKHILKNHENINEFIDSLHDMTQKIIHEIKQLKQPEPGSSKKLDEVDHAMLAASLEANYKIPMEHRFFASTSLSAPRPQANLAIIINGGSYVLNRALKAIDDEEEIMDMLGMLQQFTLRAGAMEHKFGFDLEQVQSPSSMILR